MALFKEILSLGLKYPKVFLENINRENWYKLRQAMVNEPPTVILKNIKKYFWNAREVSPEKSITKITHFVDQLKYTNKEIYLFVSHEASRTGAPLIIKKAAEIMKNNHDIQLIFLLCKGGEIESEFSKLGPIYLLDNWNNIPHFKKELGYLLDQIGTKYDIDKAYVNSAESRQVLPSIKRRVKKVICLVHELGTYYPSGSWKVIDDNSDIVVFPAKFVNTKAMKNYSFNKASIVIEGQGLIKTEILEADPETSKARVRKELNIPENSKIVLGCGTPIPRKGIDIFTFTAINFLHQYKGSEPVYFIWLGDGDLNDYKIWVQRDIDQCDYRKNILLVGNKKDTIPWFLGSDLFFMCSRGDPYPCVVHEAMAAGLPIIGFEDTGGFCEIINKNNGVILPFGDIIKVVSFIDTYLKQYPNTKFKHDKKKFAKDYSFESYAENLFKL